MGPIQVVVQDGNNLVLEVTPTPSTTVILDRGIPGPVGPMGDGDVDGPASSTDNAVARFDGTTGKVIQNSNVTIDDSGNLTYSAGTANGVAYLNGSKVLTTGSALTFDGTNLAVGSATAFGNKLYVAGNINASGEMRADIPTAGTSLVLTGTGSNFQISHATSGFATLINSGGGLIFSPSGSEQMRLTSTGLGIGTSSPSAKLQVTTAGDTQVKVTAGSTNLAWQTFSNGTQTTTVGQENNTGGSLASGTSSYASVFGTNSAYPLQLVTSNVVRVTLDSSGNLGLGVTPSAWSADVYRALELDNGVSLASYKSGTEPIMVLGSNAWYNGSTGNWIYKNSKPSALYSQNQGVHSWSIAPSGTAGAAISFTQAMTLDSSGNLGIGTSSPAAKLELSGSTAQNLIVNSTGSSSYMQFANSGGITGYIGSSGGINSGGGNNALGFRSQNEMVFATGGSTERMRIDSSGNLGLGVTPSAWNTGKAFEINAVGTGLWGAFGNTYLNANNYYNAADKFAGTGYAVRYLQVPSNGQHQWLVSTVSGTAGNAISFTQAMTLDASGNLGVGTTSPAANYRLHLAGSSGLVRLQRDDAYIQFANTANTDTAYIQQTSSVFNIVSQVNGSMVFGTNSAERARINSSGNLLVGTTSYAGAGGFSVAPGISAGAAQVVFNRTSTTSESYPLDFLNGGSTVGFISYTNTAVAYVTSSDYRLKDITGPITTSGAYIDSLNPVEGTWKADGSTFVGLIAHEVQEASRTNVATGVKDGEEMQGMDYSSAELIANMLAELKSLRARVAQLEAA